jgi:membrane fusion protein (multidrug efflux system)
MSLKGNGEDRAGEALQEVESPQSGTAAPHGAASYDLAYSQLWREKLKARAPSRQERLAGEGLRRRHPIAVVMGSVLFVLAGGSGGCIYWDYAQHFESTDDAFVASRQIAIAPKVSGYVIQVPVTDNQHVAAGGVIARIDDRD